jgi:hypothetical protein
MRNINMINRRRKDRMKMNWFVGETFAGKLHLPLATNLSEEGIYLVNPATLHQTQDHDPVVEIGIPGISHLIWARCRTIRTDKLGFFEGRALKFVNISPLDRQTIRTFVHRRLGVA